MRALATLHRRFEVHPHLPSILRLASSEKNGQMQLARKVSLFSWLHISSSFFGQAMKVKAVWKCQWTYMALVFSAARASGLLVYTQGDSLLSARAVRFIVDLLAGLGKRKRVMDEKELMMPLKLGWVEKGGDLCSNAPECAEMFSRSRCLCDNARLFACQVAKRNADQSGGGAAAGRGGLLRPLWQKTEAVPRCNEGTAAPPKSCTVASNAQSRYTSKCFEMFASRAVFSWGSHRSSL